MKLKITAVCKTSVIVNFIHFDLHSRRQNAARNAKASAFLFQTTVFHLGETGRFYYQTFNNR